MTVPRSRVDLVHATLRAELREGLRRPGAAISVKEVAASLRVSPTPVREALERLVGQGLVVPADARGFAVPRLGVRGLTSHVALQACLLREALRSRTSAINAVPFDPAEASADPARAVEAVLAHAFAQDRNAALTAAAARSAEILAPYRRVEPLVIDAWMEGLAGLEAALFADRGAAPAIRAFLRLRSTHAPAIVDLVEQSS